MTYTGINRPTNKIVAAGSPLVQELRVEDATTMYPGRLVQAGSTVDEIKVNDSSGNTTIIGWLGYEQTNPNYRQATPTTIQVIEDQVAVLNGGGFVILGSAVGATPKGTPLKAAAAGKVTAMAVTDTANTTTMVGFSEDASANGNVLVRSVI